MTDLPETHRAAREAEKTIRQGSQSQRSASPEVERTSPILPKQASHGPHQVDDSEQWLRHSNVDDLT